MNPGKGVAFKLVSAALFAVMSALIRYLGARYPIGQVVFYRSLFAIIPVVVVYAWRTSSPAWFAPSVRSDKRAGVC
jgi:drug/metabolite transporter (DMT)-like permease